MGKNKNGVPVLHRTFRLESYPVAMAFLDDVMTVADSMNHHPNVEMVHHCTAGGRGQGCRAVAPCEAGGRLQAHVEGMRARPSTRTRTATSVRQVRRYQQELDPPPLPLS